MSSGLLLRTGRYFVVSPTFTLQLHIQRYWNSCEIELYIESWQRSYVISEHCRMHHIRSGCDWGHKLGLKLVLTTEYGDTTIPLATERSETGKFASIQIQEWVTMRNSADHKHWSWSKTRGIKVACTHWWTRNEIGLRKLKDGFRIEKKELSNEITK